MRDSIRMTTSTHTNVSRLAREVTGAVPREGDWSIADSYSFCQKIATSHYENFPVGSILVPRRLRKHFYSIYAFARTADDFADEGYDLGYSEGERLRLLEQWSDMLTESLRGRVTHPIF